MIVQEKDKGAAALNFEQRRMHPSSGPAPYTKLGDGVFLTRRHKIPGYMENIERLTREIQRHEKMGHGKVGF